MSLIARENKRIWSQPPEGLHCAVCCDVVDLGEVQTEWGMKNRVRLIFQLAIFKEDGVEEELNHDFDPPRRFEVRRDFGLSLSEKSALRPFLESWRAKRFSPAELEGFDLERLVGVSCQLQLIHNITEQGKTFANIQAAVPLGRGQLKLHVSQDYVRMKDRAKEQGTAGGPGGEEEEVPF